MHGGKAIWDHGASGDQAANSLAEAGYIEVKQEADLQIGQSEIGKQLGLMDRKKPLCGLELNQDGLIHDQVGPVCGIRGHILFG